MVFAIVLGSVLMVLIISFLIYFKMKLEEENSKPVSPKPQKGINGFPLKNYHKNGLSWKEEPF